MQQTKPTTTYIIILNYEHTNKDLRFLSWKEISRDLRVFGVKFWTPIFIHVKYLTFRKSDFERNNLRVLVSNSEIYKKKYS